MIVTPHFNGSEYVARRDHARLSVQLDRVKDAVQDGLKRTLQEISEITGDPPASVSAQLRHLRKARFGGHSIKKEYAGYGLYLYWMEK